MKEQQLHLVIAFEKKNKKNKKYNSYNCLNNNSSLFYYAGKAYLTLHFISGTTQWAY